MRVVHVSPGGGDKVLVSFTYDPEVVSAIRDVPGRTWDHVRKLWHLPSVESIGELEKRLPLGVELRVHASLAAALTERRARLADAAAIRTAGDGAIWPLRSTPYRHQRAGADFLARLGSGALFWEMGTGKTAAALAYCEHLRLQCPGVPFHVLVICPNTVKRNWGIEIEKHAGHSDYVIPGGSLAERARLVGTATYTIVNCEALSLRLAATLRERTWDVVVVDESTRFKTPDAKRTKALHKLVARHRLILSGTPITGKPEDAWAQLEFVQPGIFGRWWGFEQAYLLKDFFGSVIGVRPDRVDELRTKIDSVSYRVLKNEVLDLPPKVYEDRVVELSGTQAKAYASMRDELRIELETGVITASNVLTKLLRLTQVTAGLLGEGASYSWLATPALNAKLGALDELLNEDLAGEQVVIFGIYQKELEHLWQRYAPSSTGLDAWDSPAIIYGPTPERRRAELIQQFQEGRRRLLFVQAHSGGIGVNLTAARTAIYYSRSWSLEDYLQSQDRLHRIGQQGTVTILHITARGTVDEQIAQALAAKQGVADMLTGDAARRLAATVLKGDLS